MCIDNKPSLDKNFDHHANERRIYKKWEESKYFCASVNPNKKPYTIIMPPPNVTGQLHMGHALTYTIQDILIRHKRMQGFETLWQPGYDHAAIATEAKIVEALKEEGLSKDILGREGFLERAWQWKEEYQNRISSQLRRLGTSCDFTRERFTMDEGNSDAVNKVFIDYYNKGYIYKGERLINWCPHCKTSISDAEVNYVEQDSFMWEIAYPIKGSDSRLVVATTRPETMLGDTALAVHPEDERYTSLIGKEALLPLTERYIPIIADDYVERDFGTGVVKITPAHDPNDYEVGLRHSLQLIDIFTDDGKICNTGLKYDGIDIYEARKLIAKDLEEKGFLVSVKPFKHNVGVCYRCNHNIEPKLSMQWFVAMKDLAEAAIKVVKDKKICFVPDRFTKVYYNWMENIKDWCISRQLWWGHRIPAYYCSSCGHIHVMNEKPNCCENCGSSDLIQDEDTLDTWFSSALWPFTTLGWNKDDDEFKYFYPSDVLVTGYDIIFFWVARMIFQSIEITGDVPFKDVFLHGIVRDSQGRKMSKSLGNGIDPLEIIETYGADVLRYALISSTAPGNDQRYDEKKLQAGRALITKLWNAFRYIYNYVDLNEPINFNSIPELKTSEDIWIVSKLHRLIFEIDNNFESYDIGVAIDKLWSFFRDDFCDWYIEMSKARLFNKEAKGRDDAIYILQYTLYSFLKLLHPFMPFVTEAIWEIFFKSRLGSESIMIDSYPTANMDLINEDIENKMAILTSAIRSVRNVRAEYGIAPKQTINIYIYSDSDEFIDLFKESSGYLERLCNIQRLDLLRATDSKPANALNISMSKFDIIIPMSDLLDIENEIKKLEEENERYRKLIEAQNKKLSNDAFVSRAPEKVVQAERDKLCDYQNILDANSKRIKELAETK